MGPCQVAHRHLKINLSREAMAELEAVDEVGVVEVIMMNIIDLLVEVGLLIQVGVVELNHQQHHLRRFQLSALPMSPSLPQQVLPQSRPTIHQVLFRVWLFRPLLAPNFPKESTTDREQSSHRPNGSTQISRSAVNDPIR